MSITREVFPQSPAPEASDKVLDNNPYAKPGNQTWATLVGSKCSHQCAIPTVLHKKGNTVKFCIIHVSFKFLFIQRTFLGLFFKF